MRRVLMLGLDGVTFRILDPAFEAGHFPRLAKLLHEGVSGNLTSTIPPYTPPGWTSIFTGVNPGKHGIFGFTLGNAQRHEGLVRLDKVRAPAIWNAAGSQGMAMGVFNVPMTYPPPVVDRFSVSGMLTPEGGGETPDAFTHPASLAAEISNEVGAYEIDIEVDYDKDWKSTAIIDRLSHNLRLKRASLRYLLEKEDDIPFLFVVLEAPDRLMHVHYKYIDPTCEHFSRPEAEPIRARVWQFFDEMDEMIGDLLGWAGSDAFVITMSDHGFGPKEKVLNLNRTFAEWGMLEVGGSGSMARSTGLRRAARRAKKILPKSIWRKAKTAAHARIDWSKTVAFSAPNPQQGIYVNVEGREPHGIVSSERYDKVRDELIERLRNLTDPDDGKPVVDHVYRREDVIEGPQAGGAPDLFPVCRDYTYELSDGLFSPGVLTDYRDLPRGFHHIDGIFGIQGQEIEATAGKRARIYDIAPTALYLAGLKSPRVDGEVLSRFLPPEMLAERPPVVEDMELPLAGQGTEAPAYTPEEEAQIEESLRNLGYL